MTVSKKKYVRIEHEPDGKDCPGCRFWNADYRLCDYFGETKQLRKCEPGKLCRVSERRKKK